MRRIAALIAAAIISTTTAAAQPALTTWTDPGGTLTLQRPASWPVDQARDSGPQVSHFVAGLADFECNLYGIARPTGATPPRDVRYSIGQPYTPAQWNQVIQSMNIFRAGAAVQTMSVNASTYWPMQRATISSGNSTIEAGVTARPGRDIYVFCQSFDGQNRADLFNRIIMSAGTPQDAALQATMEAAAPAAPTPSTP